MIVDQEIRSEAQMKMIENEDKVIRATNQAKGQKRKLKKV